MQYYQLHPEHPQQRLIKQIVERLGNKQIGAIPTDSGYALVCSLNNIDGKKRIENIRQLPAHHLFSILCGSLTKLSHYAQVSNPNFRLIKQSTPGPFTFILPASREIPRRLIHPKRKTVGIRIPDHPAPLSILNSLEEPLMSVSLKLDAQEEVLFDPDQVEQHINKQVDFMVHCPPNHNLETTVVDCCTSPPEIIRQGSGKILFSN